MKMRVRDKSGRVLPVDASFLELLNLDGSVARVTYTREDGSIAEFDSSDTVSVERYSQIMKVSFVPMQILPDDMIVKP